MDSDNDNDDPTGTHYDSDDAVVIHFGHAADAANRRAIASVIRRYYGAGAAGNGTVGCSLLYSLLAERTPEEISDEGPGLRDTCGEALSSFFRLSRRTFAADVSGFALTVARVEGARGIALVRLGSRERRVLVRREGGAWKVNTLIDMAVP